MCALILCIVQNVAGSVATTSLPSYVPNAGSSMAVDAPVPPTPVLKVTTSIIQPTGKFRVVLLLKYFAVIVI